MINWRKKREEEPHDIKSGANKRGAQARPTWEPLPPPTRGHAFARMTGSL